MGGVISKEGTEEHSCHPALRKKQKASQISRVGAVSHHHAGGPWRRHVVSELISYFFSVKGTEEVSFIFKNVKE